MSWVLWLKKLILPPAGPLLMALAGLLFQLSGSAGWLGQGLMPAGLVILYLLSIPACISPWLSSEDRFPRHDPAADQATDADSGAETIDATKAPHAIVILDGGRTTASRQRGGNKVTARTLERIDEGARLHRRTELPILVTGYGELMARTLKDSFGITAQWIESRSRNTYENAQYSARILRRENIDSILLVTHFWHLRRSLAIFRQAGIHALPRPVGRASRQPSERGLMALVPNARSLTDSYLLLHEAIGRIWYRFRYR